ncbi:MAG TPA: hypothetical protein VN894_03165 [Polyangiaceae bacterium]|nr:hypothetical protein [Polyangiaceae bacterium]
MPIEANWCRITLVIGFVFLGATIATSALADAPSASRPLAVPPAQRAATEGVAVVALAGATDAAWPLASSVYAAASLRPTTLDEVHAHVLCGEAAPMGAPPDVRDLAETVAAVRGDDAPSRALLGDIARRFSVRAVVVVRVETGAPSARAFLADSASFDAAAYAPDEASAASWSAAVRSLVRAFGTGAAAGVDPAIAAASAASAPALATHQEPKADGARAHRRAFYESGWFWGAVGAAAFGAGAVFLATRDTGPQAIHLQLEVPH